MDMRNNSAELILTNGIVYTVDGNGTIAQAVAVKDGKIIYIGDEESVNRFKDDKTEVVDLAGKMVLPGFFDAHAHILWNYPDWVYSADLRGGRSCEEYIEIIRKFAEANPELDVIVGNGWDFMYFEGNEPDRDMLDDIIKDRPVILRNVAGHSCWVNSKTLELLGIDNDTKDPEGGLIVRDRHTGEPTGWLKENAQFMADKLIPSYTEQQIEEALVKYQEEAHSYGLIGLNEAFIHKEYFDALRRLESSGKMKLHWRGEYWIEDNTDWGKIEKSIYEARVKADETKCSEFRILGTKFFADGTVEEGTAYLKEPYDKEGGFRNEPQWEDKEFFIRSIVEADKNRLRIHIHAIGDAALELSIDAIEKAVEENPAWDRRPAVTHIQLADEKELNRMAELGIIAVPQPVWFKKDKTYTNIEVPYLGEYRAMHEYPMKSFFIKGIIAAGATDTIADYLDPLYGIQMAVTRKGQGNGETLNPDEKISIEAAIKAYTYNGAYSMYLEDRVGSIEVGKEADLVILDKNLLEYAEKPDRIFEEVRVCRTIIGGETVYEKN